MLTDLSGKSSANVGLSVVYSYLFECLPIMRGTLVIAVILKEVHPLNIECTVK